MMKIPKNATELSDMSPQKWSNDVHSVLTSVGHMRPHDAKCAFLGNIHSSTLSKLLW